MENMILWLKQVGLVRISFYFMFWRNPVRFEFETRKSGCKGNFFLVCKLVYLTLLSKWCQKNQIVMIILSDLRVILGRKDERSLSVLLSKIMTRSWHFSFERALTTNATGCHQNCHEYEIFVQIKYWLKL